MTKKFLLAVRFLCQGGRKILKRAGNTDLFTLSITQPCGGNWSNMSSSKSKKNRKGNSSHKEIEDKYRGDIQEEESGNIEVQEMKTEDSNDDTDAGKITVQVRSSKRGMYLRVKN